MGSGVKCHVTLEIDALWTPPPFPTQWYLMSRYDNFWNNYFLFILSPTTNKTLLALSTEFQKSSIFLLSLHLYSKAMWSRWNNLCKQLISHRRIHQGKAMLRLSTPFCYTNTASSPSLQSNFSNIPCPSTPLPRRQKGKRKKEKKITTIRLKRQFWFHSNWKVCSMFLHP